MRETLLKHCPLRDSFSSLTQGHPASHYRLSIKYHHCALWLLDDNNTHSQKPHTLFFLSHSTANFLPLFSLRLFSALQSPMTPNCASGEGKVCVWLRVVMKCSPKESKVPGVRGSLHKYKCKMPVHVFFFLCCRVVNVHCRLDEKFKWLLLWLFQHIYEVFACLPNISAVQRDEVKPAISVTLCVHWRRRNPLKALEIRHSGVCL